MITTIIIFIAVLAVLVLVHEIGHFVTARWFGCGVEELGLGFPPRLYGFKSAKTNIVYSINAIPLGGFVKIKGEDGADRADPTSFGAKPAWQRAIILIAGVTMNVILAAVLLMIGFGVGLPTALPDDPPLLAHAQVRDVATAIYQ
ncbi:MAG: site-2 protease family protein, partial [Patescibacteria group bacterium]